MKTNEGNSLLWGASVVGAPFGPRGSVAWLPVLGPSVVMKTVLAVTAYAESYESASEQQHSAAAAQQLIL